MESSIPKLDKIHHKKRNGSKLSKEQRVGPESCRLQPSNAPSWAINSSAAVTYAESDEDTHEPLSTPHDTDDSITPNSSASTYEKDASDSSDIDSDPELENWIQEATTISTWCSTIITDPEHVRCIFYLLCLATCTY